MCGACGPQRRSATRIADRPAHLRGRQRRATSTKVGDLSRLRHAPRFAARDRDLASTKVDNRSRRRLWTSRTRFSTSLPQRRSATGVADGQRRGAGDGPPVGLSTKVGDRSRRRTATGNIPAGRLDQPSTKVGGRSRRRVCSTCLAIMIAAPQRRSATGVADGPRRYDIGLGQVENPQRRSATGVADGTPEATTCVPRFCPQRGSPTGVADGADRGRPGREPDGEPSTKVGDRSRRRSR